MNDRIDLREYANKPEYEITIVSDEERQARIRIAEADANHRRQTERIAHLAALIVIVIAVGVASWILITPASAPEERRWGTTVITSITLGLLGYVTGRAVR